MYRLPLLLNTPSVLWDRTLPEYVLFNRTLNVSNLDETMKFIKINEQETVNFFKWKSEVSEVEFTQALKHLHKGETIKAMEILNIIIFSASKDDSVFHASLRLRGNIFYSDGHFDLATRDFEIFTYVAPSHHENLIEVYGKLVISYYMMNNFKQSKSVSLFYQKQKKIMKKKLKNFQPPEYKQYLETNELIVKIISEMKKLKDEPLLCANDEKQSYECFGQNINALWRDTDLSFASTNKLNQHGGFVANRTIPGGTLVFAEKPLIEDLGTPFVQCEHCLKPSFTLYTCLDCRYKTYCSLNCMLTDCEHDSECCAYRDLTLLTLDARHLFRLFIRTCLSLCKDLFMKSEFKNLKDAARVWDKIMILLRQNEDLRRGALKLISDECDYSKLSDMQYSTIVATSFRLTIYLSEKTDMIETFFSSLDISYKQKMILVGSLLIRLDCQILNNTLDFDIKLSLDYKQPSYRGLINFIKEKVKFTEPTKVSVKNIMDYYGIENDVLNQCESILESDCIEETPIMKTLSAMMRLKSRRALDEYKSFISSICLESKEISTMDAEMRQTFVRNFTLQFHTKYSEYFVKRRGYNDLQSQCIALTCPYLRKFPHSCDPNIEIIFLKKGVVIGKTIRELRAGEELCVSFKVHYQKHPRTVRKDFLQPLKIVCSCKFCRMPQTEEPYNTRLKIFCQSCSIAFSPANRSCYKCGIKYDEQLNKIESYMLRLDNTWMLERTNDEGRLLKYYLARDLISRRFYPHCHEFRIIHNLQYSNFLACKNFAKHAFEIVEKVFVILIEHYPLNLIWFTHFNNILDILKILLYYNINRQYNTISTVALFKMVEMGLFIVRGQLDYIKFYEIFDSHCVQVMEDLRCFFYWKEILALFSTKPLEPGSIYIFEDDKFPDLVEVSE